MKTDITKELIFDHFSGKTSPIQRKEIDRWLGTGAHDEQYYAWLEEWESSHLQYVADTDQAAVAFSEFLGSNPVTNELPGTADEVMDSNVTSDRKNWRIYWVAASVALIVAFASWLFRDQILYVKYQTAYGEVANYVLPDGSHVKLNTNSVLLVPRWGFGAATREVFLTGDASFSVVHTLDHKRFVVKSPNDLQVVVLGTEFTVYARKHFSKVILKNGKVQLLYNEHQEQKELTMKPGDLVTFNKDNQPQLKTTKQAQSYSEWEERRFVFEETSLEEIAYLLQENYGLTIDIKGEELSGRMLMGSFRARNVDELLQSISELLDISVVRQGNHVQLSDQ